VPHFHLELGQHHHHSHLLRLLLLLILNLPVSHLQLDQHQLLDQCLEDSATPVNNWQPHQLQQQWQHLSLLGRE
jgi:hypothetical protein